MNTEKLELFLRRRKMKVELGLLMAVFWTLLAVAVVFNFNAIIYHLGYLQVYIYNHHLSDIIMWTIYIRFIALVFVFSSYFSFRYFRHIFKISSAEDDMIAVKELDGRLQASILYSCSALSADLKRSLNQFSRADLIFGELLGAGNFGTVLSGELSPHDTDQRVQVALKSYNIGTPDAKNSFHQEAFLMSCFKHDNIIQYIGVCESGEENFIIMELMRGGDLLKFLKRNRAQCGTESALTYAAILPIIIDVAQGCRYLETQKIVHRDLACRNCLLTSNDLSKIRVKISDFGMTRKLYTNDLYQLDTKKKSCLPFKWMAPESLSYGLFTTKSDVWTFGVLCWEVLTLGEEPYEGKCSSDIITHIRGGGKLEKPVNCPDELFTFISKCWNKRREKRPRFSECCEKFEVLQADVCEWGGKYIDCPAPTPRSAKVTRESAGKSMKHPVLSFNKIPAEGRRNTLEMHSVK